jgi:uncharacterized protein
MNILAFLLALQFQIPDLIGYVNDFAHVLDGPSQQQMLAVMDEVRRKSGGEIVVVTLPDLGGRRAIDVARDIGRQWKVGAQGGPGDRARNAGVILLLRPGQRPGDGRAEVAIASGTGAEGFITDAFSGRVRDAISETAVQGGSYAAGMVAGVWLIARAYAREFGFELTGNPPAGVPGEGGGIPPGAVMLVPLILFVVLPIFLRIAFAASRFRRPYYRGGANWLGWLVLSSMMRGGRRGGRGGGGWGGGFGGGGFGGGGFGGFGGGGGFSGGGASGRF